MAVVLDPEGGVISARDVKAAREVIEDVMTERDFQRLSNRITDEARDSNTGLTRATRDRDRATPRDVSHVDSPRLQHELADFGEFRSALSSRQRKTRSATKNRVMASAPASQRRAVETLLGQEDQQQWQRINYELHQAAGDVQQLADTDRALVQRLDRAVQSYEQLNDRTHNVYVAVELPDNHPDVNRLAHVPDSLRPGARVAFDQFTVSRHNLHETPGHDSGRHIVFEIATNRGMYLGKSDSVEDTQHVLPRSMAFEVAAVGYATYATGPTGYRERIVVQLREIG